MGDSSLIPEGWCRQTLGNITDARSSNVDKKSVSEESSVLLCNYTDVYYNSRISSKLDFMKATATEREVERFSLMAGDVIITKDSETPGDIAVPAYVEESLKGVVCGYHLTLLRPRKDILSGEFLAHLMNLPEIRHHFYLLANGITRFGLTAEAISNAPLVIPPLPEQRKIAAILTSVDRVIEQTQAQIDKLKMLKTGMMQELLSPTPENYRTGGGTVAFKDSPLGLIPEGWEVVKISELCSHIVDCVNKTAPTVDYRTPFKMIRTSNVRHGRVCTENVKYVTEETYQTWTRRLKPQDGDIIFTREAPVGESGILKDSRGVFLGQRTMQYRVNLKKGVPEFLMNSLQSEYCKSQIEDLSGGSTVPHMRVPDCEKLLIKTPSLEEQKKIAEAIGAIDAVIELRQANLSSHQLTKKALMQDLLTGKVRVNTDV